MFNIGDVVKVVDAREGGMDGPHLLGREVSHYKQLIGEEFTILRFKEDINCFYDRYGNSFYTWRLELVNFSLENE